MNVRDPVSGDDSGPSRLRLLWYNLHIKNGPRSLAESVKVIDVIVGGHSHTKVMRPTRIGNTWIVQAWEHGKALGVLDGALSEGMKLYVKEG